MSMEGLPTEIYYVAAGFTLSIVISILKMLLL